MKQATTTSTETRISRELRFFIKDVIESRNTIGSLGQSSSRIDRNIYLINFFKPQVNKYKSALAAAKYIQAHIEDLFELTPKDNLTLMAKLSFLKTVSSSILQSHK